MRLSEVTAKLALAAPAQQLEGTVGKLWYPCRSGDQVQARLMMAVRLELALSSSKGYSHDLLISQSLKAYILDPCGWTHRGDRSTTSAGPSHSRHCASMPHLRLQMQTRPFQC